MALLICLAIGLLGGIYFGGWTTLRHARRHELESAARSLRWGSFAAGGFAMVCTTLTLGWPMKAIEISVTQEVTRTVVETVQVPVRTWRFWTTETEAQDVAREITEELVRSERVRQFSVWMLVPMAIVGVIGGWLFRWSVRVLWRWFP